VFIPPPERALVEVAFLEKFAKIILELINPNFWVYLEKYSKLSYAKFPNLQ